MTTGDVELVRLILAEWARGNFGARMELLDPEITFETFMPDADENVTARGITEIQAFTRDWLAQWRDYRIVADEFFAVGPGTVFAAVRQMATGQQSGARVESPGYSVWTLRQGRVVALSLHYDREQALEAVGLKE